MAAVATVFIVDDDAAVRDSLALLVNSASLNAECFSSAIEFLDAYDVSGQACLVVDMRMPEMSGLELIEKLTADGITLPVILMSGHSTADLGERLTEQSVFKIIPKPCQPRYILEVIQQAVSLDARRRQKPGKLNKNQG